MRTGKQGQAAVPRERVRRRRFVSLAWGKGSGPWENIPRTVTHVERYPEALLGAAYAGPERDIRDCHERCRVHGFLYALIGACGPDSSKHNGGKQQ